ncbi:MULTISPECIES: alpha/beta fold hydrolase [Vibrio]|jgi:predicted alpha/beta-hydrolase family hydrolase|uniref:Alpha/beta hydrolase n=1 Tax=Vibrio diabolicus TaxID=50719 RepID=A0ABM6SA57_9VIBR|nr:MULTISPECIES: alpha/beta fold hydrolase [Vibrio]AVH26831.1 alpha/beta hydrolase [Vibrio diabolicus]MCE3219041.1 alpha/beta fold hydrolase [Vibrio diabolicus]MCG6236093.1 alpha/beta fold hydrolase [Vibrio diabolicus]MCR9474069.1 alpha/beta fold hydrolase [Vibrio diabolicus]MCS0048584.1 alpha/beta fold hydrolase [Vibrio antiquarius]
MSQWIVEGPESGPLFIFAHGAGAGMEHDFMAAVAKGLVEQGIRVVRFNFPYMIKRAEDGKKRPPDRAPKLLEAYEEVIAHFTSQPIVIGGKSMGGRMSSLLAENELVAGIACLGFPFHPPGKPEKFKGDHLANIEKPTLILQGERDTFGKREEFDDFVLSSQVKVSFLPDGDHSFKPRKSSGHTEAGNIELAVEQLAAFIKEVYREK